MASSCTQSLSTAWLFKHTLQEVRVDITEASHFLFFYPHFEGVLGEGLNQGAQHSAWKRKQRKARPS